MISKLKFPSSSSRENPWEAKASSPEPLIREMTRAAAVAKWRVKRIRVHFSSFFLVYSMGIAGDDKSSMRNSLEGKDAEKIPQLLSFDLRIVSIRCKKN